jgi:hypothetical protein
MNAMVTQHTTMKAMPKLTLVPDAIPTEESLVNNIEMRNRLIDRTDVLDKVKQLFLIPGLEMMTTRQVAEYYEVPYKTIGNLYSRNKEELDLDGVVAYGRKQAESLLLQNEGELKTQWTTEVRLSNGDTVSISNALTTYYPKRAVLRVGMLLRETNARQYAHLLDWKAKYIAQDKALQPATERGDG